MKEKTSPNPNNEIILQAASAEKSQYFTQKAYPYINEGTVYGFELSEELVEPTILPYESSISALFSMSSGNVFGLTSGNKSHLFYFNHSFFVVDVAVISENETKGGALIEVESGALIGGWHEISGDGGLFFHNASSEVGTGLENFIGSKYPVEFISMPYKNDGVCALAYNEQIGKVFGLTTPGNKIFSFDLASQTVTEEAEIESGLEHVLTILPDGSCLGACAEGQLWNYEPETGKLNMLDLYTPSQKGKRYAAGVQSLICSKSGKIYGGTSTDGFLFEYDHESSRLVNLGKPNRQSNIRALAEGEAGLIYGIVEEPHGMAHLFTFDTLNRGFSDLGIVSSYSPAYWTAHSIGCICKGCNGEIFLGETDTISHLFIYYPPV